MVGLVIVSHSRALAEALVRLISQVANTRLPIAVAAGVGDDRQQFGTDAVEISEAIQSVYSDDGVLVIMDLGSAVLSAEMAVELLPPEFGGRIRFCAAPLVEGSLAAAVQIGLGNDLEAVCREAEQSLRPKVEHLGSQPPEPAAAPPTPPAPDGAALGASALRAALTLNNQHGLHARPAARFVQTAGKYNAAVQVTNLTTGKGPVSAASVNGLATLGAVKGHRIQVGAAGPEAAQALDALSELVENNFGESVTEEQPAAVAQPQPPSQPIEVGTAAVHAVAPPPAPADGSTIQAVPVSEGIALGPFYPYQPAPPPVPQEKITDPAPEQQRLERAIERTRRAIEQRYHQLKNELGEDQAAIFEAHLLILQDPEILANVRQRIQAERENAALAWSTVIHAVAETYRSLPDAYQQGRAADVLDIGGQVLFALAGQSTPAPVALPEPVILFAQEITPTETAQLDMSRVLGILTVGGGPTSHSAILARALGIPAISGVPPALSRTPPGAVVGINGFTGTIQVEPRADVQQELRALRQKWLDRRQALIQTSRQPAATRDGRRVEVYANVGNVLDAQAAVQNGAEGVGLLRTEFLFLAQATPPTEDEQLSVLTEIGQVMGDLPVTIRTLDVGGDKNLPYIQLPQEANPFLGVRAIRMSLRQPELFIPQLRAILRAGEHFKLRVMFPMIANLDEFRRARGWLEKAHLALQSEGLAHAWPVETGMMIEIPSAALLSRVFAREVDFFSIGTNDLTQYTLAAERGNPLLSGLADALHPAVLRLIQEVVSAAHAEGKWAGICGELAGDAQAAPILVGLGVDELSLNPGGIPLIKSVLRQVDSAEAVRLAERALQAASAEEVRGLVRG